MVVSSVQVLFERVCASVLKFCVYAVPNVVRLIPPEKGTGALTSGAVRYPKTLETVVRANSPKREWLTKADTDPLSSSTMNVTQSANTQASKLSLLRQAR